jgi:putative transposase
MYSHTIFSSLLKVCPRSKIDRLLASPDRRRQSRVFNEWDHLVSMIYGQVTSQNSLRQLVYSFNEHFSQHYHLGVKNLKLSTLSYANNHRDVALFSNVLSELIGIAGNHSQTKEIIRLIDSSPIYLNPDIYTNFAKSSGRCMGAKLHIEHDLQGGYPTYFEITPANVNDIKIAENLTIIPKATYVFDRGYMKFSWWEKLDEKGCHFVSRMQKTVKYNVVTENSLKKTSSNIHRDIVIKLTGRKSEVGFSKQLRLITVQLDNSDKTIEIVSNDLMASAVEIANLYKRRWEIELLLCHTF